MKLLNKVELCGSFAQGFDYSFGAHVLQFDWFQS